MQFMEIVFLVCKLASPPLNHYLQCAETGVDKYVNVSEVKEFQSKKYIRCNDTKLKECEQDANEEGCEITDFMDHKLMSKLECKAFFNSQYR